MFDKITKEVTEALKESTLFELLSDCSSSKELTKIGMCFSQIQKNLQDSMTKSQYSGGLIPTPSPSAKEHMTILSACISLSAECLVHNAVLGRLGITKENVDKAAFLLAPLKIQKAADEAEEFLLDVIHPEKRANKTPKKAFYFTFGGNTLFPYQNGWVKIFAHTEIEAREIFKERFPNPHGMFLTCGLVYTEEDFAKTTLPEKGLLGGFCHEVIGDK